MNKFKKLAMAAVSVVMAGSMVVSFAACADNPETVIPTPDPEPSVGTGDMDVPGNYNVTSSDGVVEKNPSFAFSAITGSSALNYVPSSGSAVVTYLNSNYMSAFETKMKTAWVSLYKYYAGSASTSSATQTKLTVASTYPATTVLRMNVCDGDKAARQVSYASGQISGSVQMLDGNTYDSTSVKPAWQAMGKELGLTFSNVATGLNSDKQVTDNLTTMGNYDILTASSDAIVTQAISSGTENPTFLDLNLYLDEMPNYKAFLEANPIVQLSLTSDTSTGAMYYAPYFDGNDDIEKYELMNRIWVKDLLDTGALTSTVTFAAQAQAKNGLHSSEKGYTDKLTIDGTKAYAVAYMGSEDWTIEATDPTDVSKTKQIYILYSKALAAVKDEGTPLGAAYVAAAGTAYTGESGNIVDIMNAAINAKSGAVTGAQLVSILREYIDVTYCADEAGTTKAYATRSDVFVGEDAAWDVDLLVALSRCLVTNQSILTPDKNGIADTANLFAIAGRQNTTQRNSDLYGLAGELYGIRGMTSRYQFAYISGKSTGELIDARTSTSTYDAMENMHYLVAEGLLYLADNMNGTPSAYAAKKAQTMMMYDYVQTQTRSGFDMSSEYYDFAPVVTPVSKWDTDDDGKKDTTMRFTESWRSVKNTGFCVPYASVKNDSEKLAAVLAFIDYLYSNDGQIVATFGPKATSNTSKDGFWYATEASSVSLDTVAEKYEGSTQYHVKSEYASQYFVFKNKVYSGTAYKGTQIPTLTDDVLAFFRGEAVTTKNGNILKMSDFGSDLNSLQTNYTDFARGFLGAALPIGNKNQGFEYQCTAQCGLEGASIVGNALANGVIKHVNLTIDKDNLWYTSVPTTLPYSTVDASTIKNDYSILTSNLFGNSSGSYRNVLLDIIYYGFGYNL